MVMRADTVCDVVGSELDSAREVLQELVFSSRARLPSCITVVRPLQCQLQLTELVESNGTELVLRIVAVPLNL
jgi:hypothetical protein